MKIYTKTGDNATTSLVGGIRISKADAILDVYGCCDELNAQIGALAAEVQISFLTNIQEKLFIIGGILATPAENYNQYWSNIDLKPFLTEVENEIDQIQNILEPLQNFLLPQGNKAIAQAHICRTICRKLERKIAHFCDQNERFLLTLQITNRLSDYFFILARYLHIEDNIKEKYLIIK